ncbi:hypothetical protein PHLGIDRAFT_494233 [Phlebiopsis gigantea 11061_1 CR5-6]|uniref:FYVE-type domain-containing protein n=1 Tax=Phlebiopsis gigantea (strain 11061_1 CR5-6) TaxID=745531 RepID=A0A0C3NH87_PHLG1|nr:hypothetical protein PHLGIDRAFT_494233 [Phlebiopsis gigantea 11061_1 CR5-6]
MARPEYDPRGHDMVDFPPIDGPKHIAPDAQLALPPHLPFRRISLPSAPNLNLQRQSIVSLASFDSILEGHTSASASFAWTPSKGTRPRPSSVDPSRRNNRRREVKSVVVDEQREAKRRRIINELYETERSYVDGLELIYSHFLTPIIASLDTPNQLLDRAELTSIFSNFIDIWNLHRSFYSSLFSLLSTSSSSLTEQASPPISPILLSHFPYLSLYTPFVSSFSDALSSYTTLLAKYPHFATFMTIQEEDPRCGKLKFRDWLLTIVQRCPRYLLLLKDLINNTSQDDPEHQSLVAAHTLVSKITDSLNASLHTHAQTLSLLAIQKTTSGLPFPLITPGRTFFKRGPLYQVVGSTPKEREFLLFSDRLVWLSNADKPEDMDRIQRWEQLYRDRPQTAEGRPALHRTRSKSDADLLSSSGLGRHDSGRLKLPKLNSPTQRKKRPSSSSGTEEKWTYKGHIDLVDLQVILGASSEPKEELRFEVLSPRKSFAVYASSTEERDEWAAAIRNAKASLLIQLNVMHPNSTLTSSSSTNHLRHALQAVPYSPEEESQSPKRGRVEHFVPAIWIPDSKTESCMRCGRTFGWRRRRHHCRLCGRCVCHGCSTKTFFIVDSGDSNSKPGRKSARACDACYDTVFPVLEFNPQPGPSTATITHLTLSGLRSMPSLLLDDSLQPSPSVLMAIDIESPRRPHARAELHFPSVAPLDSRDPSESGPPIMRLKMPSRPRSYIHILEDFHAEDGDDAASPPPSIGTSPATSRFSRPAEDASPRQEDTVRRRKRFSLPAVAIHTTPVTTRPNVVGEGKSKRWSLVLGNLKSSGSEFAHGVAAGKLSELLGRQNKSSA